MRHVYVNRAAIVLAVLLVVSTALFAWWRSRDLALVVFVDADAGRLEALAADDDDRAEPEDWAWQVPGGSFYAGSCRGCHVRLTHVPELFAADGGRPYLIDLLLFGFEGEAPIDGSLERFDHPPVRRPVRRRRRGRPEPPAGQLGQRGRPARRRRVLPAGGGGGRSGARADADRGGRASARRMRARRAGGHAPSSSSLSSIRASRTEKVVSPGRLSRESSLPCARAT
jgi:hypothetical protein